MSDSRLPKLAAAVLLLMGAAVPASAQTYGVRGGASVNPDQVYIGAHFETGPLVDRLHFRPNLEVGFGDHVTATTINLEVVYKIPLRGSPWTFYGGGGPAINYYSFEHDGTDARGGLTLLGGLQHTDGFFFEVKAGAWDSPDLKVGVGYTFRPK